MTVIKTLELTAFGKFTNEKIELDSGLCEFYHRNEWGKSTVCDFILFMLYGAKAVTSKKLTLDDKHLEKYLPWSGDGFIAGALELLKDGDLFRIERRVTKRGTARVNIYKNADPYLSDDIGFELFGVGRDTFMRTFLVRQTDIRFERTADCETALSNLVTTGDESVSFDKAIKTLDKLQTPIQSQKQRTSGKIPSLRTAIASAQLELSSLMRKKEQYDGMLVSFNDDSQRLALLQGRLNGLEKMDDVARANDAAALVAKLDALADESECAQPLSHIEKEYMQNAFTEYEVAQNTVDSTESMMSDIRFDIASEKSAFADYDLYLENEGDICALIDKRPSPNIVVLSVGIVLMLAGALTALAFSPLAWIAAAGGLALAILAVTVLKYKVRIDPRYAPSADALLSKYREFCAVRERVHTLEIQLGVYEKNFNDAKVRLQKAEDALKRISAEYGIDSREALNSRLADSGDKLSAQRMALLDGRDEAELYALARGSDGSDMTSARLASLRAQISTQIAELTQRLSALESARLQRENIMRDIAALENKIKADDLELLALEYKNDVYSYVREALCAANEKIKNTYSPILTGRAAPILSALTGGKYDTVSVDTDFNIRVKADGEYRELGYFSRGTADAVYFTVRLCMADILCEGAPLILDDPFWSFDKTRLENAMTLINKISHNRQVLLFGAR